MLWYLLKYLIFLLNILFFNHSKIRYKFYIIILNLYQKIMLNSNLIEEWYMPLLKITHSSILYLDNYWLSIFNFLNDFWRFIFYYDFII
jgi:hypothetical protein